MPTIDSSQPPSPIERILIFHLDFPEKCLNGKSLGEGASVEEISESILYYHRDQRCGTESPDEESDGKLHVPKSHLSLTEEAVQFLGLCTALRSLPASLGDPELQNDKTNEIYFGNSTLVFIPLESSQELLAVAQVSRLYQNGNKLDSGGGNPLAVRASIERCHRFFCMLRGGGIIHRLADKQSLQDPEVKDASKGLYPGMDKLFALLKQLRRLREQLSRQRSGEKDHNVLGDQIDTFQREMKTLRKSLPIQSVRRDLDAHYKQYLGDLSVVVTRNGGASRCLVETIPVPIAQDSGSHVFQSFPSHATSYSVVTLGLALRKVLQDFPRNDRNDPHLLGVSTFHQGQLIYTHASDTSILQSFADTGSSQLPQCINVSNEIACLVMGYMASYRTKMSQLSAVTQPQSLPSTPPRGLGLKRLTLSFGSLADEAVQNIEESSSMRAEDRDYPSHFMSPPPLFMFSALDHAHCFEGRNKRKVWAPRIHLPVLATFEDRTKNLYLDTHVVLFELGNFSFLLYVGLETADANYEQPSTCKLFLTKLEEHLSEAVLLASENVSSGILSDPKMSHTHWDEPGQDLVLVNRAQHKLILFSDRKPVVAREKKKPPTGRSPPRRFLGFGSKHSDKKTNPSNHARDPSLEWSALGLDCRHLLASHLHLDTILAFDDMMNEVARTKGVSQISDSVMFRGSKDSTKLLSQGTLELCTCMPLGWIYAFVDGETELYAFFDSSIYVTVADVQSAALKIQGKLFGQLAYDE